MQYQSTQLILPEPIQYLQRLSQDLGFRYIIQHSTLTTVNGKVKKYPQFSLRLLLARL